MRFFDTVFSPRKQRGKIIEYIQSSAAVTPPRIKFHNPRRMLKLLFSGAYNRIDAFIHPQFLTIEFWNVNVKSFLK